jgi:rhodanese-related sulfurtransferase
MTEPSFFIFMQEQWILFLALALIIFMLIHSHFGDHISGFASLQPSDAVRLMNDGAFILDVRSVDEFRSGHLTGAKNLPLSDIAQKLDSISAHKTEPTIVYCESGMRSSRACGQLVKAGFTNLHNLSGGVSAWRAANLPLAKYGRKK